VNKKVNIIIIMPVLNLKSFPSLHISGVGLREVEHKNINGINLLKTNSSVKRILFLKREIYPIEVFRIYA